MNTFGYKFRAGNDLKKQKQKTVLWTRLTQILHFGRSFGKHLLESLKISHSFFFFNDQSEYFHLCTTLGGDDYIGHPPVKYSKSMPMLLTDP